MPTTSPPAPKPAQADRVHMRGAMNGGAPVRFGDDQQFAAAQKILHVGRQRRRGRATRRRSDSRGRAGCPAAGRAGSAAPAKSYSRIAEKGEIVVVEPAQEILGLGDLGLRHRRLRRRLAARRAARAGSGASAASRRPRPRTSASTLAIVWASRARFAGSRLAGDLDLHPGFTQARRFAQAWESLGPAASGSRIWRSRPLGSRSTSTIGWITRRTTRPLSLIARGRRIDEKRHVVVDDLDDRVRRRPAVGRAARGCRPGSWPGRDGGGRKTPQRQRGAGQIARAAPGDIGRRHMLIK